MKRKMKSTNAFSLFSSIHRFTMTALMPRGVRWLEVGAVLALFLVIQVSANETGKLIVIMRNEISLER